MDTASKPRRPPVGGSLFAAICLLAVAAAAASPHREFRAPAVPVLGPCSQETPTEKAAASRDRVSIAVPARIASGPGPAVEFVDDLGVWASTPWPVVSVQTRRAPAGESDSAEPDGS